jgi:photosystem II stability/assembly factor-like uncharacterized protein
MKVRTISFLLTTLLITQFIFSQSGWFWQNPLPQGNWLNCIQMFDANTGYSYNMDNIIKTTDGGENWQVLYTGFNTDNTSLSMIDVNTGYILLDSTKIIKTFNGGYNWNFISNYTARDYRPSILYFTSQNTGFLFGRNAAYYTRGTKMEITSNGGLNWSTQISDTCFELTLIDFPSDVSGYITGRNRLWTSNMFHLKIYKTSNGGANWDSISNTFNMIPYAMKFINESTGFIGGQYYNLGGRLLKTTNGGLNWILNDYNFNGVGDICFVNQDVGYVLGGSHWLYKTTNGGVNWSFIDVYPVNGHNDLYHLFFTDLNIGIGVGTGGLIVKTSNGGINWTKKSQGNDNWLFDVKFSDVNTGFAAGDNGTLLCTTNGGVNWNLTQFYHWDDMGPIAPVNSSTWYIASSPDGKIFKTTNTGLSWDTLYTGLYAISRLEFINQNTGFGVCKYHTFFKTTNGGLNWLIYNNLNYSQNWVMDFIDENTGYAGDKIAKTTNGGLNWDTISLGMDFGTSDVQFINYNTGYVSGTTNDAYIGYTGYVIKTTNGGISWIPKVITNSPIEDLFFVNEMTGYCAGWNGVFKTIDGSQNWYQIRTCNNSSGVIFFTDALTGYIVGSGGTIIKTTNGGGEPIGIQTISTEIPTHFVLYQNYPNPFNPSTTIKFSIPTVGAQFIEPVQLRIYDILGREVAVLVNEQLSSGTYEVDWNASNFASGIYFYQLSINNEQFATKKMVLLK